MRIVIHAPVIHSFIHPAGLPRSEAVNIAQGLTAALADMGIRVEPSEIEILPDSECSCRD
ncbi:hypothetical protein [Mycolicibacterium aubagnense]|uniref:Uncharacterized protein n=1 Tax=Mycolicibacterium aubagnense TaxID=319707 RepID=A0ABN5Z4K3_9MYCO|nr:hypothetical protein [Mycolicibacterium aubagnense]TLH48575.1 hypothetical protein C1S80_29795 [Mycolicibacterium aubagnense]BBX87979.1 hypothetical protein MAUB_58520 [Mycolicibacterium aubagnense]